MPSTPRPTGAEGKGSTAPECLQVLRTYTVLYDIVYWVRQSVYNIQHLACKASKQRHPTPARKAGHARKAVSTHCNAPLITCTT
jgi:hypothetical protein